MSTFAAVSTTTTLYPFRHNVPPQRPRHNSSLCLLLPSAGGLRHTPLWLLRWAIRGHPPPLPSPPPLPAAPLLGNSKRLSNTLTKPTRSFSSSSLIHYSQTNPTSSFCFYFTCKPWSSAENGSLSTVKPNVKTANLTKPTASSPLVVLRVALWFPTRRLTFKGLLLTHLSPPLPPDTLRFAPAIIRRYREAQEGRRDDSCQNTWRMAFSFCFRNAASRTVHAVFCFVFLQRSPFVQFKIPLLFYHLQNNNSLPCILNH